MNTFFDLLNRLLGWIPGNGRKTYRGLLIYAVAYALKYVQPDVAIGEAELDLIINYTIGALLSVQGVLDTLGIGLAVTGVIHKVVKWIKSYLSPEAPVADGDDIPDFVRRAASINGRPQWETGGSNKKG
jgi:hypothetical protein